MSRGLGVVLAAAAALTILTGCEQKSTEMSMEGGMKAPPRAPELSKLDVFEGKWEESGECDMGGQKVKFSGMGSNTWEVDRRVLVGRGEMTMGDSPDKFHGLSMWTWDAKAGKYNTFWVDSGGGVAHGTASYDEATKTWKMSGKSRNTHTGDVTVGEGTTTIVDNNTLNWTYTEWDSWKMKKGMDMKGTSKRRP